MATETLRTGMTVTAICAAAGVSETALRVLAEARGARDFVERLADEGAFDDAVAFLAHALPRREAVSWAWLCAREAAGEPPPPAVVASLDTTRSWLDEPTESHGTAALRAAEVVGLASPAGLAGLAAFLCGESHAHGGAPSMPPPPRSAAAKAIAGCIHLTAEGDTDADIATCYAERVRCGLDLADRIDLWAPPRPPENGGHS